MLKGFWMSHMDICRKSGRDMVVPCEPFVQSQHGTLLVYDLTFLAFYFPIQWIQILTANAKT